MTHQDDLDIDYKAASQEQPSQQTDQLILQAATDAIETDNTDSSGNKVVKGKFSVRRWQMPVSIAAAAVITVSFISTMNPWDISVVDKNPQPATSKTIVSNQAKEEKSIYKMKTDGRADKDVVASRQSAKKQNLGRAEPESITELSQLAELATIAEPAKLAEPAKIAAPVYSAEIVAEKAITVKGSRIIYADQDSFKKELSDSSSVKAQQRSEDLEADFEDLKPAAILSTAKPAITSIKFLSIDEQLEVIEKKLQEEQLKLARAEVKTLLKQHPLDSFSKQQLSRFDIIQQQLKLTK